MPWENGVQATLGLEFGHWEWEKMLKIKNGNGIWIGTPPSRPAVWPFAVQKTGHIFSSYNPFNNFHNKGLKQDVTNLYTINSLLLHKVN